MAHGEFQHTIEQQPSATRGAAVEPEDKLVQVAGQVLVGNGSLMCAQQPALGRRSNAVDSRQQAMGVLPKGSDGPLATRLVDVPQFMQPEIALPAVRNHGGAERNTLDDQRGKVAADKSASGVILHRPIPIGS
jgi:hypothetical protein